jgi:2-dehydropantoate 2-reductase
MKKKIIIVGAGAVGGYVGGFLALAGEDVTLVDPWPEHIETIKKNGLHITTQEKEVTARVNALHLHEVQALFKDPAQVTFVSTKSYDTEWATRMIAQYLTPDGFVVSMQNSINEERIAGVVGWGKTVGCIVSGIGVDAYKAGHIRRSVPSGGASHTVFRVGEVHGRVTQRATDLAAILDSVDSAKVTTNLWGERWTKLIVNAMYNAVSAVTGLDSRTMMDQEIPRRLSIKLGGEAVRVGRALGYELEPIRGMSAENILTASEGDQNALEECERMMLEWNKRRSKGGRPSTAQDILKGRRTEIDFINGLIAEKGGELGLATPANLAIADLVSRIESGDIKSDPEHVAGI